MTRDELIELLSTDTDLRFDLWYASARAERELVLGEQGKSVDTANESWQEDRAKRRADFETGVGLRPAPNGVARPRTDA